MQQDQRDALKEAAYKVGHKITGMRWQAHNDGGDRQGVFDTQDYLVLGVDRVSDRHYEKEEEHGDPDLHEYIATFDPETIVSLVREIEALENEKLELEEHAADLENEASQWDGWDVVPHEEVALVHVNRRAQVRLRSTDRIIGTITHVSSGRSGGPFEPHTSTCVTISIKVAGSEVHVHLRDGDTVAVGPDIESD